MSESNKKSPQAVQKRNEPSPMKMKKSNEISKDVLQNKTKRPEVENNQHHEVRNQQNENKLLGVIFFEKKL